MKSVIQELDQVLLSLRSGGVDPLKALSQGEGGLHEVLKAAMDQGQPLLAGVDEFRNQVLSARVELTLRKRLKTLIAFRTMAVLSMVSVLRIGLSWTETGFDFSRFWGGDYGGALLLGFWGVAGMMIAMPRHWLWKLTWTPLGFLWLKSYLGLRDLPPESFSKLPTEPLPWSLSISDCDRKEIAWGVSLAHEKQRILRDFALKQREHFLGRITLIEESLPIWELLVLGPLSILGLALPSIAWMVSG